MEIQYIKSEKFYSQSYVKKEVERYNNWILNLKINNKNFNKLVLDFLQSFKKI